MVIIGDNYAHLNYVQLLHSYINNVHLTWLFLYRYDIFSVVGIVLFFREVTCKIRSDEMRTFYFQKYVEML